MIVTMVTVREVKMTFDQIAYMVAVGHGFVATSCTMHMPGGMTATLVLRRAPDRINVRNFY